MIRHHFFDRIPDTSAVEIVETILTGKGLLLERIVSYGQASPEGFWYDQDRSEWVMVLTGRADLKFEDTGDIVRMGPGDHIHIPAHRRHRVEWTDDTEKTVWLALHHD